MKSIPQFEPFEKIPRFFRNVTITEKIDGTNASIHIVKPEIDISHFDLWTAKVGDHLIWAGSRTRWITPDNDNFGFAKWVANNAEELVQLGVGTHRGEWWGNGAGAVTMKSQKKSQLLILVLSMCKSNAHHAAM